VREQSATAPSGQFGSGPFPSAALLKPYRRALAWGLGAVLLDTVLNLCRPWPLKIIIDRVLPPVPKEGSLPWLNRWLDGIAGDRMTLLLLACGATILVALGTGAATFASKRILGRVGRAFAHDLRGGLFAHLQRLSLRYHDSRPTGDTLTRLTSDVSTVQETLTETGVEAMKNIFQGVALFAVMFWMNPQFALVSLWTAPLLCWTAHRVRRHVRESARAARASNGRMASVAQETLTSMRIVQGLSQERQQQERFQNHNRRSLEAFQQGIEHQARMAPVVDLLEAAGLALVMGVGALQVMNGTASVGDMVVFFAYLQKLTAPMKSLSKVSVVLAKARASSERIRAVLAEVPEVVDRPGAVGAPAFAGGIEFRGVTFLYAPGRPALSRIQLRILPGEKVALFGPSGSGKSTMLSLIARLYDPDAGAVLIDGRDVREYRLRSVRDQVSLVLQDTLLFSGSVKENVAFGRPGASDEEIVQACALADADEFIRGLPDGYDTDIAERGCALSGGQRQRLALARAILRRSPILLLDEPTTGLDAASEEAVIRALERAAQGRTTILVSHRPNCTRIADRIVVLDRGEIVETGTRSQLLERGGLFAKLHAEAAAEAPLPRIGVA
jgi:ATP-binding cassette, subfamily B, bacterial